jgi:hypothetical protein
MNLPIIPQDKANHFIYGAVIAVVAGLVANQLDLPVVICSVGAATLFGAAKEALDWYKNREARKAGALPPHGVEIADFLFTVAGGVSVNLLFMMHKNVL